MTPAPQLPQIPIQSQVIPNIEIQNPFTNRPIAPIRPANQKSNVDLSPSGFQDILLTPSPLPVPPAVQRPEITHTLNPSKDLFISNPNPAPSQRVIPAIPPPPPASPWINEFPITQAPQPLPQAPIFAARPILRHTIRESCEDHDDCVNGAVCISGTCTCPASTIERDGKCLKIAFSRGAAMPGESCENGELCSGGSLCDSGMKKCICAAGHDGTRGTCIRGEFKVFKFNNFEIDEYIGKSNL